MQGRVGKRRIEPSKVTIPCESSLTHQCPNCQSLNVVLTNGMVDTLDCSDCKWRVALSDGFPRNDNYSHPRKT